MPQGISRCQSTLRRISQVKSRLYSDIYSSKERRRKIELDDLILVKFITKFITSKVELLPLSLSVNYLPINLGLKPSKLQKST